MAVETNHSIAHSFGYLETKIQVCGVTGMPVTSQSIHSVKHKLSDTDIYYWMAIFLQYQLSDSP